MLESKALDAKSPTSIMTETAQQPSQDDDQPKSELDTRSAALESEASTKQGDAGNVEPETKPLASTTSDTLPTSSILGSDQAREKGDSNAINTDDTTMDDASPSTVAADLGDVQPGEEASRMMIDRAPVAQAQREDGTFMAFDPDFIETARANRDDLEAEFAEDSDPAMDEDSTDSDDSDSDDTSSDDDSDYGSIIMDPAEAARMLMRAGSEEGGQSGPPRTINEQQEKPLPIPEIPSIKSLKIVELGHISHIIARDNCVVIKATRRDNHNVLQPGTALCLENRTLIRPISDTIAQVQEPYYISYYESAAEMSSLEIEEGTVVYYPDHDKHRSFVFVEELRKQKFTDASNINDEEVDRKEMEFSDDEEEAAYKKAKKEEKHKNWVSRVPGDEGDDTRDSRSQRGRGGRGGARGDRGRPIRGGRGGRGGWIDPDGPPRDPAAPAVPSFGMSFTSSVPALPSVASFTAPQPKVELNYDDEDGYTPQSPKLDTSTEYNPNKRPDNYGTWGDLKVPERPPSSSGPGDRPSSSGGYASSHTSYVPPDSYSNMRRDNNQRGNHRGRGGNRPPRGRGGRDRGRGGGGYGSSSSGYRPGSSSSDMPFANNTGSNAGGTGQSQTHALPPKPSQIPPPPPNWQPGMTAPPMPTQGVFPPPVPPNWHPQAQGHGQGAGQGYAQYGSGVPSQAYQPQFNFNAMQQNTQQPAQQPQVSAYFAGFGRGNGSQYSGYQNQNQNQNQNQGGAQYGGYQNPSGTQYAGYQSQGQYQSQNYGGYQNQAYGGNQNQSYGGSGQSGQ